MKYKSIKYSRIFLLVLLSFSLLNCAPVARKKVAEGIKGNVTWLEGNAMPSPDRPQRNGIPAKRTLYIYKLTKPSQVTGQAPLFTKISAQLVATVKTDQKGYYKRTLIPGKYSVFTLEKDGRFFANLSDGEGNIGPVEVKAGEVTTHDIAINYKAAY